jgi:hypothetical protein
MAMYPVKVRDATNSASANSFYALQGLSIPQQTFRVFLTATAPMVDPTTRQLDTNQAYWIKMGEGPLQSLRLEVGSVQFLSQPECVTRLNVESDRREAAANVYRLYIGDSETTAVEVTQDPTARPRFSMLLSLG